MKSVPSENGRQITQSKKSENGNRQWIIFFLFILAVFSIIVFLVLRIVGERTP